MPPQPPQSPGNGRESLALQIGGKSVGIQAASLTSVLLLLILGIGGYLLYISVDHRLEAIVAGQAQLQAISTANKEAVIEALHMMQTFLTAQVTDSQQRILAREQAATTQRQANLEVIKGMLRTHEFNQSREASDKLPLDLPPDIIGGDRPLRPVGP